MLGVGHKRGGSSCSLGKGVAIRNDFKIPGARKWENEDGKSARIFRGTSLWDDPFAELGARVAGCCRATPPRVTAVAGNSTPFGPRSPSWFRKSAAERADSARAGREAASAAGVDCRGQARRKCFVPYLVLAPRERRSGAESGWRAQPEGPALAERAEAGLRQARGIRASAGARAPI